MSQWYPPSAPPPPDELPSTPPTKDLEVVESRHVEDFKRIMRIVVGVVTLLLFIGIDIVIAVAIHRAWVQRGEQAPCSITAVTVKEVCDKGEYTTTCSFWKTHNCRETESWCGTNDCREPALECCKDGNSGGYGPKYLEDDWVPGLEVTLHWSVDGAPYVDTMDVNKNLETGKPLKTMRIAELYADFLVGRNGTCYYDPKTLDAPDMYRAVWD